MQWKLGASLLAASFLIAAVDDWPRWRGPNDDGVARGTAPVQWTEKNIVWKAEVPGRGHSSPVIWGDRIFLTTAVPTGKAPEAAPEPPPPPAQGEGKGGFRGGKGGGRGGPGGGGGPQAEQRFVVMCFDRNTGKLLWEQTAATATPHEGYHRQYGSFASNSPITDGKLLYANFGSRGLYAYTLDGKLVWKKDLPPMKIFLTFGEGVPTVLHEGTLLIKHDNQENSFLVALNAADGKEKWRVARDEGTSWSPPLVVMHEGRKQVVVSATSKTRSYDFANGELLWEASGLGRNVIPAPVQFKDVVIVQSGYTQPNMQAIKLGRTGDLTGSDAILWSNTRGNSYTPSPVLHEGVYYFLTDNGMLSAFDALTGKPHYHQQRLPKPYSFKASPVAAAGHLYLAAEDGDVVVVKMGESMDVVATNSFPDEMFVATPAIVDGRIYLRGRNTLYSIR
jgi:outer membrane protein assembly factor BamB